MPASSYRIHFILLCDFAYRNYPDFNLLQGKLCLLRFLGWVLFHDLGPTTQRNADRMLVTPGLHVFPCSLALCKCSSEKYYLFHSLGLPCGKLHVHVDLLVLLNSLSRVGCKTTCVAVLGCGVSSQVLTTPYNKQHSTATQIQAKWIRKRLDE